MTYIEEAAEGIRGRVDPSLVPKDDSSTLLRLYAVLATAKGIATSPEDVHDAWCAWMQGIDPSHDSIRPYSELDSETAAQDEPWVRAIHEFAESRKPLSEFDRRLFPHGLPIASTSRAEALDAYRVIVQSSEALVARRQGLNTFFLSANGALLTALGVLIGSKLDQSVKFFAAPALSLTGIFFSYSWSRLVKSYGQLNTGKFKVINRLERELPVAVYDAEWLALEEGNDRDIYEPFTKREGAVPWAWFGLFVAFLAVTAVWMSVAPPDVVRSIAESVWRFVVMLCESLF